MGLIQQVRFEIGEGDRAEATAQAHRLGMAMGGALQDGVESQNAMAQAFRDQQAETDKAARDAAESAAYEFQKALDRSVKRRAASTRRALRASLTEAGESGGLNFDKAADLFAKNWNDGPTSKVWGTIRAGARSTAQSVASTFAVAGQRAGSFFKANFVQYLGAQAIVATVIGLARTASSFIVGKNLEGERLTQQLITLEGTTERAQVAFARMESLAKKTPFEIADVTDAFIRLRAQGIQPTEASMLHFSDFAASKSKNISDLIDAATQAAFGETERLKAFHVRSRIVGDQITLTYGNLTKTVGRDARQVLDFLEQVSSQNFAGASARLMETLTGRISNMKDALSALARALGAGGLNDLLGDLATKIEQVASAATGTGGAKDWMAGWADGIRNLISWVRTLGLELDLVNSDLTLLALGARKYAAMGQMSVNPGAFVAEQVAFTMESAKNQGIRDQLRAEREGRATRGRLAEGRAMVAGGDFSTDPRAEFRDVNISGQERLSGVSWRQEQDRLNELRARQDVVDADNARKKAERDKQADDYAKAIAKEVGALEQLHGLNVLTGADLTRLIELHAQLSRQSGGTAEERAGRAGQVDTLATIQKDIADKLTLPITGPLQVGTEGMVDVSPQMMEMGPGPRTFTIWDELWEHIEEGSGEVAGSMVNIWESAFTYMREEGATTGRFMTAIFQGIGKALLGGIASFAGGKVQENVAYAIEAMATAFRNSSNPWTFGMVGAALSASKMHWLAAAKWGALAGGAGAFSVPNSGGGGGGGSVGGAGANMTAGRDQARDVRPLGAVLNLTIDGFDPDNQRHVGRLGRGIDEWERKTGGSVNVRTGNRR